MQFPPETPSEGRSVVAAQLNAPKLMNFLAMPTEGTKQETRVSEQSGYLGARARSPTQGGLSLRESNLERGHHLVF